PLGPCQGRRDRRSCATRSQFSSARSRCRSCRWPIRAGLAALAWLLRGSQLCLIISPGTLLRWHPGMDGLYYLDQVLPGALAVGPVSNSVAVAGRLSRSHGDEAVG